MALNLLRPHCCLLSLRSCPLVQQRRHSLVSIMSCRSSSEKQESSRPLTTYDAYGKEAALRAQAQAWNTANMETAQDTDIPRIDIGKLQQKNGENDTATETLVEQLRHALKKVGFYYLLGHDISPTQRAEIFTAVQDFYNLPTHVKQALLMDRPGYSVGGVGYLPLYHHKLPTRQKGNANEAFVVKRQAGKTVNIALSDNQWPPETVLPGFQAKVVAYIDAMEQLALKLLPLYARALDLDTHFFDPAFSRPMYRFRMTKYPPMQQATEAFGIAPHVDTSFLTILDQDCPGLVIYSEQRKCWLKAPYVEGALIVNSGELLRQWTNDTFVSVKHFANHNTNSSKPRYSIPFFFNANASYRMHCIPTCCSPDNPPRYPPSSYEKGGYLLFSRQSTQVSSFFVRRKSGHCTRRIIRAITRRVALEMNGKM